MVACFVFFPHVTDRCASCTANNARKQSTKTKHEGTQTTPPT
jgi:hypothetical protein